MKFLFILSILVCNVAFAQVRSGVRPGDNKAILTSMDSLVKVMERKKNELAGLLTDFLFYSKEVDKTDPVSKPGKATILERINYSESIIRSKTNAGTPMKSSIARLDRTVKNIKKNQDEIAATKAQWKNKKDALSEMSEMDMLMLQQMMEKKNQLESMISNVMKAGYEGGQAAVQALKGS